MSANNNFITNLVSAVEDGNFEVKGTASVITIKVPNRAEFKTKLYKLLDKKKIKYEDVKSNKSSFNVTELNSPEGKKITLVYKDAKGGGSGAGAEVTELAESAQCWYTAVAFNHTLESYDDFIKYVDKVSNKCDTDASIEKIMKDLPEDWVQSSILIANYMKKMPEFVSNKKKYQFHRGSATVDKINSMFLAANKEDRLFANINKWSPADIWLMTAAGKRAITSANTNQTFASLNSMIMELYESRDLIGVSLKKVGKTVGHEVFNYGKNNNKAKLKSFKISEKSKDGYIIFSYKDDPAMSIQFRSFTNAGSWQGEIKGKFASGGKIGGGQVAEYMSRIGKKKLASLSAAAITKRALANDPKLVTEIIGFAKSLGIKLSKDIGLNPPDWLYSKYLTLELFSAFDSLTPAIQSKILREIIGYSSSATENSGVFIKIS